MTGHAQIGIYLHASAAIQFTAEFFGERRGGDAGSPDDVAGVDDFSVGEFHHTFADAFDLRVGFDIHAEMDELPLGFFRKAGRQMRQDARSAFEQNDVRLRGINACLLYTSLIIVNLSGRGDKDVAQVAAKVKLEMPK